MKTKHIWISVTLCAFFYTSVSVYSQEGHPSWWWQSKTSDLIVEGVITYDPNSYYELNPINISDPQNYVKDGMKYYWIVGKLKIKRVLYVNKDSQHLESYHQYLKKIDSDVPVLIPAYNTALQLVMGSAPKTPALRLRPLMLDITDEPTIFNLSQIFIFPILNLKLESVVPREEMGEAVKLIEKRGNNLLKKH